MNVLFLLVKEHHRLGDLFRRCRSLEAEAREERRLMTEALADELRRHARAEQEVFYPALAEGPVRMDLRGALEQHAAMKTLLDDVRALPVGDPAWGAKVDLLGEHLDRHVRSHHAELFPAARQRLSGERLLELGRRLERLGLDEDEGPRLGASALMEAAATLARTLSRAVGSVLADVPRDPRRQARSRRPSARKRRRRAPVRSGRTRRLSRTR